MSVRDWMWLIIEVVGLLTLTIGFVWKAVKQPIDYELKDIKTKLTEGLKSQGERLGGLESGGSVRDKSLEELRRMDQQHSFEIAALQREHGRFEGMLEKTEHTQEMQARATTEIQVQLGKLDTKMNIFAELRDVMGAVLDQREQKKRGSG